MSRLSNSDLTAIVSAISTLNADIDAETLPERALSSVQMAIEADSVAFTGFRYEGEVSGLTWDSSESLSIEEIEIFGAHVHEQPLFSAYLIERRTDTLQITDLIPASEFEKTGIYNEFYKRVGVKNQLVSPLAVSNDLLITCSINTTKPDFSERDRTVMDMMAPHLIAAIRNAFAYGRLNNALEAAECGVVAIDSDGKVAYVSDFARRLFGTYFAGEDHKSKSLPTSLQNWLKHIRLGAVSKDFEMPREPLKIVNREGELTVRHTFNRSTNETTLLLEERLFPRRKMLERLEMTRRETEILFWVSQGKSDKDIADICGISPRTVHKHIENIYTKLGVETRTAAMLKAIEAAGVDE